MINKSSLMAFLFISLLAAAGCSVKVQTESTATVAPLIITSTLPATPTLDPSQTPLPPPQPTVAPVSGRTSTQLNVRVEPSTASKVIGIVVANSTVQIVGKDRGENWWQILYEAGEEGKGWVTAQYVETVGKPEVPVIGVSGINTNSGTAATVIQQLNIRSGPGTSFNSLGVLNANDVLNLTGKNREGTWLQIDFPAGPVGKGWVSSAFVKTDDTTSLPIISEAGSVIGTGTPIDTPLPATPTLIPAPMDFDSADSPIKTVILGGAGAYTLLYNGDVSFPEGDTDDWISVTSHVDILFVGIECQGSGSLHTEIVGKATDLVCNEELQAISVSRDAPFLIHIRAIGPANPLVYTKYKLVLKVSP